METWSARNHSLAVWELTLACNLRCSHCGSAAGKPRPNELSTKEALETVQRLKERNIKEITLIGGEATIRQDWMTISRAIVEAGIQLTFQTGGYHIDQEVANQMASVGTRAVGVSIDGLASTHNKLRGREDSFENALTALKNLKQAGIPQIGVYSQINRVNFHEMPELFNILVEHNVQGWQISPTIPMGSAISDEMLCFQPCDFEALHELAAILSVGGLLHGISVTPTNAMGYFAPYERLINSVGPQLRHYPSCPAGNGVLGIEADGTVKGCPSLPTELFATGSILEDGLENLDEAVKKAKLSNPQKESNIYRKTVHGFCSGCPFSLSCKAGCPWATTSITGERGDNPYCMFRSIVNNASNNPEFIKRTSTGTLKPFALGTYKVIQPGNKAADEKNHFPKPIDIDEILWPARLNDIAASFKNQRATVREQTLELYQNFKTFPMHKGDATIKNLEKLEAACFPKSAHDALAYASAHGSQK